MAESDAACSGWVWIRLVRNDVAAKVAVDKLEVVPGTIRFHFFGGPRPPSSGSGTRASTATSQGTSPASVFLPDPWHSGLESADTSFDLGPAFDDVDDARKWITEAAGRAWAAHSINYFLLCHSPAFGADMLEHKADLQPTPSPPKDVFPKDDWDPLLLKSLTGTSDTVMGRPIRLGVPASFGGTGTAVLDQMELDVSLRPPNQKDINFEAQGLDQVTYSMLQVVGLSTDHPVNQGLKVLRDVVLDRILPVLWYYKLRDPQQPRPRQLRQAICPEFERPHWRNPGHPSFPAGHATVVYTWSTLLSALFPGHANALDDKAQAISRRREIAGLHFPCDTAGGKALGQQIAAAMLDALANGPSDIVPQAFVDGMCELQRLADLQRIDVSTGA